MKQLSTRLLIDELNRRLNIINSETTDLREQMINDLSKDLEQYENLEMVSRQILKKQFLEDIIEDAQQVHCEYILEQLKQRLNEFN